MTDDISEMNLSVENLGGVDEQTLTFGSGVTVLTGPNATNRTSLLRSIGAALGGSSGELKADADEGSVSLTVDGTTYTRTFERDGESVRVEGDPYTDGGDIVDGFCSLLADNPGREAVERADGDALREFIMRPVDTDEIRATIERTQRSIRSLRDDIDEAERERERAPELERQLEAEREKRTDLRDEIESIRAEVEEFEGDADDAEEAEAVVEDLRDARDEFQRVRSRLETQRNALDSIREEREEVEADLEASAPPPDERSSKRDELERLQRREREVESAINSLLSIVEFNEELLSEEGLPGVDADGRGAADLDPESKTVDCWTCGTAVERRVIDGRLDDLRDLIEEKRQERNELRSDIDDLQEELREIRSAVDERESLEAKLEDVEEEIAERESRIERLEDQKATIEDSIEELEAEAAASDDLRDSDLLERYQRLSELEYERGQVEERIESLETELEGAREAAERLETLESRLEERRSELAEARGRIEALERSAVETFNDHMETVLGRLGYGNVERVWIERLNGSDASASEVSESEFELHVVRSTDGGVVYEDTVDHLSESEQEVIGLVVALAGYLVHDVHETVPVMLLDSMEAIDADRIAALVEYFADFVPFLVIALLPEDAAALDDEHDRVRMVRPAA